MKIQIKGLKIRIIKHGQSKDYLIISQLVLKRLLNPNLRKKKNISTPIFIANSVVSREWGQFPVIANIEWTNVEHILLFCQENRICFYKDKTFLDPSAVTCKQLYPFIPDAHEIRGMHGGRGAKNLNLECYSEIWVRLINSSQKFEYFLAKTTVWKCLIFGILSQYQTFFDRRLKTCRRISRQVGGGT